MSGRAGRELRLAVLLCLLGAGLALVVEVRPWVSGTQAAVETLPPTAVTLSAAALDLPVRALALLGLAGVPALAATKRWGRVLVGLVVLVAGVALVVLAARVLADPVAAAAAIEQGDVSGLSRTAWPAAALLAGLLLVSAGLLVAVRGPSWARLSARYDAPGAGGTAAEQRERPAPRPEVAAWEALDRGEDPTGRDVPDPRTA